MHSSTLYVDCLWLLIVLQENESESRLRSFAPTDGGVSLEADASHVELLERYLQLIAIRLHTIAPCVIVQCVTAALQVFGSQAVNGWHEQISDQ